MASPGAHLPSGGMAGQVLKKLSTNEHDTGWEDESAGAAAWGSITGTLADQTDLQTTLDGKSSTTHHHDTAYEPLNANIQSHIGSVSNPHSVTKSQIGMADVDNTSDVSKPVSTATQTALDGKASTTHHHDANYEALGAVAAHAGAADPHTGYQRESEKSAANGYASLDGTTKVPIAQLPTGTSGTTVSLGDHTHAGGTGPTIVYKASDQTAIGTAYADVTGLGLSVLANKAYAFEFVLICDADATTTGIDVACNGPASPTAVVYEQVYWTSATARTERCATAYDGNTASTASNGTARKLFRIRGVLQNGANAGTLIARAKREAVGTGPNVRAGSYGMLWALN